jgi:hypothetical protein
MRCISEALQRFSLLELNVSDNALGAKGIEACRAVLSCSSLQVRPIRCFPLMSVS